MRRILLTFCILICFCSTLSSQTIIKGRLIDMQQHPIPLVSVSYRLPHSKSILGFAKTKESGEFEVVVKDMTTDSLQLDFNHLSYRKKSVVIANKTARHIFILSEELRHIDEIVVDNIPITRSKDTINYDVNSFTSKQDRVIADIIKKLPGIEMEGGKILYQGKPIQKYMVNNLDLMEGRYAMINNNLPLLFGKQ